MKIKIFLNLIFITLFLQSCTSQNPVNNWTHFRGSDLNGIADGVYPIEWTDSTNVEWKTAIPGRGWSSPVIYGNQIWLTTASSDGKEMFAICNDFTTGEVLFNIKIFEPDTIYRIHAVNSYATPTPCIEAGFVYVHYGRYGTACINTNNGEIVWARTDLQCEHVQGPGSSPVIYKDKLILHLEGVDIQYIIALDKRTGETLWMTERPKEEYKPLADIGKKAYITPIIMEVNGRDLLISNGSAVCIAYDPETGAEVWKIIQGEDSTISMPLAENGVLYFYTSFVSPEIGEKYCELLAVNPDGKGDIGNTNVIWRVKSPPLQLLTPVIHNGLIYTIDAESNVFCLDASNGNELWRDRLKGKFNSSPVAASGNIYFHSTRGETFVFSEGKEMNIVSENQLDGEIWATPAFLRDAIIVRTSGFLYRLGD